MKYLLSLLLFFSFNTQASFTPTDGTVDLFDLSAFTVSPETDPLFSLIGAGMDPNDTVRVPISFDPWAGTIFPISGLQVEWTPVDESLGGGYAFGSVGGPTIILPEAEFDIVWFDSVSWVLPTTSVQDGPASYELVFGDSAAMIISDVADVSSVPVPAAAWLFGSGLLGLVGVARRSPS